MSSAERYLNFEPNEQDIELSKKAEEALRNGDVKLLINLLNSANSDYVKNALEAFLKEISKGDRVSIFRANESLSSQKAVDFLEVSRPHFVQLLEAGAIPFHFVGKHRRVYFKDLKDFKEKREKGRKGLDRLAQLDQELGLY